MSEFIDSSRDRRPDAVTFDYLTVFSFGPVAMQDPSGGTLNSAWRARYVDGSIRLARSLGDSWEEEVELFEIEDGLAEPVEIDLAFTFSGDPVVCLERPTGPAAASEIWIYYFDATIPGFLLENFGDGRNPRAVIDQPTNPAEADVQVFYVSNVLNALVHRQQRDRYADEYFIANAGEDTFLQEALIRKDKRIELVIAVRNEETGRYSLDSVLSELYPVGVQTEEVQISHLLTDVVLRVTLFLYTTETEDINVSHTLLIDLHNTLLLYSPLSEELDVFHSLLVEMRNLLLLYDADSEDVNLSHSIVEVIVTPAILFESVPEELDLTHSLTSVLMEPA